MDRPHILKVYNSYIGGVDLWDMLISLCSLPIRLRFWYLRRLNSLIDFSERNDWLLCGRLRKQKREKKLMSFFNFRIAVADALIKVEKPQICAVEDPLWKMLSKLHLSYLDLQWKEPLHHYVSSVWLNFIIFQFSEKRGRYNIGYTQRACLKRRTLLCWIKNKDCFLEYHTKD